MLFLRLRNTHTGKTNSGQAIFLRKNQCSACLCAKTVTKRRRQLTHKVNKAYNRMICSRQLHQQNLSISKALQISLEAGRGRKCRMRESHWIEARRWCLRQIIFKYATLEAGPTSLRLRRHVKDYKRVTLVNVKIIRGRYLKIKTISQSTSSRQLKRANPRNHYKEYKTRNIATSWYVDTQMTWNVSASCLNFRWRNVRTSKPSNCIQNSATSTVFGKLIIHLSALILKSHLMQI